MYQLILESENEYKLKLIMELAENLAIQCLFIPQVNTQQINSNANGVDSAIKFIQNFSQETTSFGEALAWQKIERQERILD
jgi:hypothetical protein